MRCRIVLVAAMLLAQAAPAWPAEVPPGVRPLLPPDHEVLAAVSAQPGRGRTFHVVALAQRNEPDGRGAQPAPVRPLLLFTQDADGPFRLAGRNDAVVMRADQGGQCDPFKDGGAVIAVKGPYFTIQNGVACGQHWTDYITFRFDAAGGRYVFDNERLQSWSLNPSTAPDAEALVPDGKPTVRRPAPGKPVRFEDWRPSE